MAHPDPLPRASLSEHETVFQLAEAVMGFVPNSLLTMGRKPPLLEAFAALVGQALGPGRLDAGLEHAGLHDASAPERDPRA